MFNLCDVATCGFHARDQRTLLLSMLRARNPQVQSEGKLKRNMMPQALQGKRNQVHIMKAKRRQRLNSALPVRLTSCIFPRPVTRITSHLGNEVRHRRGEENLEKPQQLCAYRRLWSSEACSSENEFLILLHFINDIKIITPGESLGHASAGGLYTYPKFGPGQPLDCAEMTPERTLYFSPSLFPKEVTSTDIRRQTRKVKKARKKLEEALKVDRLIRDAERAGSPK
ncbi:methyl-CpG-binding domain protein 3-like 2B [Tupaia chinensis]|uniref:methyl-CpG-binding domain protein 3-like 2B n=1 Tax=Tupaia chinensis TaxID=246437 RepID=UPI000FFBA789|nr:methyl-CpG-binding domain protein 3-like 2B [Tupaia chinensis]